MMIIDSAVTVDYKGKTKEIQNVNKYQDLA